MQEVNTQEIERQTIPQAQESNVVETTQVNLNEDKPKQNSFLITLLSILLLLACVIAGFFAYQTQTLVKELTTLKNTTEPTPVTSPLPTEAPVATGSAVVTGTENWKTYTNAKFSFKYMDGWDVYSPVVEGGFLNLYIAPQLVINEIKDLFSRGGGFGGGKFLTFMISETESLPSYKSDEFQNIISNQVKIDNVNLIKHETTVIQDMQGFNKGDKTETIIFPSGNKYFVISLFDYKYKKEFDQILSTFKFTN